MGFTTGFIGGVTLTTSILYFSIALHQRNRAHQATLLRQQRLVLTNIIEPVPEVEIPSRREERVSVLESAKDRWNKEITGIIAKLETTDWRAVREGWEKDLGDVWAKIKESGKN